MLHALPRPTGFLPTEYSYTPLMVPRSSGGKTISSFLLSLRRFREIPFLFQHGELCAVVAYPGRFGEKEFGEKSPEVDNRDAYHSFGGFAQKTVSIGCFRAPETNLHTHDAPTIQGTSGGLLVPFADGPQGFAGIHVGGAGEISLNFAIQSTNINLAISYCDAIATHTNEYRLMNRDRLKDYVDGVTEQLSPPRQSQIHHLVF